MLSVLGFRSCLKSVIGDVILIIIAVCFLDALHLTYLGVADSIV